MKLLHFAVLCFIGLGLSPLEAQKKSQSSEYPSPLIREERAVVVNGVEETWQLRWAAPPKPVCEPSDVSLTCPCQGFAYGEGGELDVVRLRNGSEVDRLHITPLFDERVIVPERVAIVQRWPTDYEKDFDASLQDDFQADVAKRPVVQVMHFADYDHDGAATEFYLQTEALPCGKSFGIVIGISRTIPQLHVFGTASHPGKPLHLQKHEWEALRDATGPVEVLDWPCGDHGSQIQTVLRLHWTADGIEGAERSLECTREGNPGEFISEEPL